MTAYTLACTICRQTAAYTEKLGHDLYETSENEGWTWTEKTGWRCGKCNLARISHPVRVTQATML